MNWNVTDTLRMKILRDVFTESPVSSQAIFPFESVYWERKNPNNKVDVNSV